MQVRWWAWQQLLPTLSWLLIILCTVQATDAGFVLRRSRVDGEIGSSGGKAFRPRRVLTDADFVHATSTHAGRYALARASRSWRQGSVRSMVVVNNREHVLGLNKQGAVHLEHYASWHDTNVSAGAATITGSTSSSSDVGSSTSSGSISGSRNGSNSRVSTVAVLWNGGGGRQGNVTTLLVGPGLALAPTLAHA